MKEKQLKALKWKARQLGLELIEEPSAGRATAEAPVQRKERSDKGQTDQSLETESEPR